MLLNEEQLHGLGVALNEATLLGVEVDTSRMIAAATFAVLTLPEKGSGPEDRRVQFLFQSVSRVAASLRNGRWNDEAAEVVKFDIADLLKVVGSFSSQPVYGWEFFDLREDKSFVRWANRLSLNYEGSKHNENEHTIDLFQEYGPGPARHLDLRIWFEEFVIRNAAGREIPLAEFIAGGKRWWDGLYTGDRRTDGFGIFPGKGE